jgi:hypothetical protein
MACHRRRRRRGHSYAALRARYGHSFAGKMKDIGRRIHKLAQDHPAATAAITGASVGTVAGGLTTGMAATVGGAAGVAAAELSKR